MARVLLNNSLTANILAVLAYDDDGTLAIWTTPGVGRTLTNGAGFTATGITAAASETFGSSTASAIFTDAVGDGVVLTTPIAIDTTVGSEYISTYAAVVDYDDFSASTMAALIDWSTNSGNASDMFGVDNYPGTGKSVFRVAAQAQNAANTAQAGNTKYGIGGWFRHTASGGTDNAGYFYGAAGAAGGTDGPSTLVTGNFPGTKQLRAFLNADNTYDRGFRGKVMALAVWKRQLTSGEFATLNANPIGALFQTGGALVKKLKVSIHPSAAGASGVRGRVLTTDITAAGAVLGVFSGKTFEATTEGTGVNERAVLKVPASECGCSGLAVNDTVYVSLRSDATNPPRATEDVAGTIIEE